MGAIRKLRVLWLGHWHSNKALHERKAVNQAATAWSRGFLNGLASAGCEIKVCTHCWEQYWPRGTLFPGTSDDFDYQYPVNYTRYVNLPVLRNYFLEQNYRKMVAQQLKNFKPNVVFTYNLYPYHSCLTDILVGSCAKWVPIILDQNDPVKDDWAMFRKQSEGASAIVFLSYWGFKNCPLRLPVIHLDGGVEANSNEKMSCGTQKIVVYSGKYDSRYGGLDVLFKIFNAVKTVDCKFVLTGKDPNEMLKKYLKSEKRAESVGFLAQDELHKLNIKAKAFINPRPPYVCDNRMAFPSKLLNYLKYGKPVISTWTDGLSPEYRDLLWVPDADDECVKQCALLVDRALALSKYEEMKISDKILGWISSGHTWEMQANKLVLWLHDEVGLL